MTVGSALGMGVMNPSFEALDRFRKFFGLEAVSASRLGPGSIGPAGRRREALFNGWLARLRINGDLLFERGLPEGRRHRRLGRCSRLPSHIGGARALVAIATRTDRWAVQPKSMSFVGHGSEHRRRGRLGTERAVNIPREVSAGSGSGRVASSSLMIVGPAVASGAAQGSLSNYRLKLTARGRPGANALRRARAAA